VKKRKGTTFLLLIMMLLGIGILSYPTVSDYYNSFHQSRAIANYNEALQRVSDTDYTHEWQAAVDYNQELRSCDHRFHPDTEMLKRYQQLLDPTGTGIMGYIEIPKLHVILPIYHGTDDSVLQVAIGHIAGTSLPIGGKGTHSVLSGHRGLPSAKLFTDLDQMEIGDTFSLRVLDEVLSYEIDQILIVLPYETEALEIVQGEDYCTLTTCTPYGINTHRMLVRGHRMENLIPAGTIKIVSEAMQIDSAIVASFIAIPCILLFFAIIVIGASRKNEYGGGIDGTIH